MITASLPASARRLRTLLVDDEPLARERMRMLLGRHTDVQVLAECGDGSEAVNAIDALAPDLVFLDIEMPRLDGFGVLQELAPERLPAIVFVSGHDRYALKAFETYAVDYLLKPLAADRLDRALDRLRTRRAEAAHGATVTDPSLRSLVDELRGDMAAAARRRPARFAVKHEGQLILLGAGEIEWIGASGNYVEIHARGKTFLMRETMKHIEERLEPEHFVRIHRGAIVNIDHIATLEPWMHGELAVTMRGGARLMASRVYVVRLKALIRS